MRKILSVLIAVVLLLPISVGAIELNSDDCQQFTSIPVLADARVHSREQANGNTGCSISKVLVDGDQDHIIGLGLEIASIGEGPNAFESFRQSAQESTTEFNRLFCAEGSVTECSEQFIDIEGNFLQVIDWHNTAKDSYGGSATVVEEYKGYVLSLRQSESNPLGRTEHPALYKEVLKVMKSLVDSGLTSSTAPSVGHTHGDHTHTHTHEPAVEVVSTTGEVELVLSDGSTRLLSRGENIPAGSRIYTGLESEVTLRFADGHTSVVRELSDLAVTDLRVSADSITTRLLLRAGDMSADLIHGTELKSDFVIKTPTATCSVRGTRFSVGYDEDSQETSLKVEEGSVEIQTDSGTELVEGGKQALTSGGAITLSDFEGSIDVGSGGFSATAAAGALVVVLIVLIAASRKSKK